mmetsp:Transcript_78778/g.218983  ORF Transcript_78778/g.218983 Transcript_78778/m.218983 type:complete len:146 (-) Transcript_78778:72-509(-)
MLSHCRSIARITNQRMIGSRYFHKGGQKASRDTAPVIDTDSKQATKLYHTTQIAQAVLLPIALVLSPSSLNMPIDFALGVLFPFHSYVAVNYVITDYVPKVARSGARMALFVATIIAAAGMLKINVTGPGLTATVTNLWRKPKKE